ncbi:MAG: ComEC/Rec2 family competence protein, partial [Planctomycetota bacterium]
MGKIPLLFPLTGLISGILVSLYALESTIVPFLPLCLGYLALLLCHRRFALLLPLSLWFTAALLGYSRHSFLEAKRHESATLHRNGDRYAVTARVLSAPVPLPLAAKGDGKPPQHRLILETYHLRRLPPRKQVADTLHPSPPPPMRTGSRLLCYVRATGPIPPLGTTITALYFPHRQRQGAYPGDFDQTAYHRRLEVSGQGSLYRIQVASRPSPLDWRAHLYELRTRLVALTFQVYPAPTARFLAAVLFGCRNAISQSEREDFHRTGTGHLLAISGLHVGLFTGAVWTIFSLLRTPNLPKTLLTMLACLLYLGLSGGRPSAIRAGLMALLYLGGGLCFRPGRVMNALSLAALLILAHRPEAVGDAGFLLSFVAVIFLSQLSQEYRNRRQHSSGSHEAAPPASLGRSCLLYLGLRTADLLRLSIFVWLGLWPLCAYYFHMLAIVGIFLNVLVIPTLSGVLIAGLFGLTSTLLPAYGQEVVAMGCAWPSALVLNTIKWVSQLSTPALHVNPPCIAAILLYYLTFLLFFLRRRVRLLRPLALPLVLLASLYLASTMGEGTANATESAVLIPSGYGEMVLIRHRGKRFLVGHLPFYDRALSNLLRGLHAGKVDHIIVIEPSRPSQWNSLKRLQRGLLLSTNTVIHVIPKFKQMRHKAVPTGIST